MKVLVAIHEPPPVEIPPKTYDIHLKDLTLEEVKALEACAFFTESVPRLISQSALRPVASRVLTDIHTATNNLLKRER